MHTVSKTLEFRVAKDWFEADYDANFDVDGIFIALEITGLRILMLNDIYEDMIEKHSEYATTKTLAEERCFEDLKNFCTPTYRLKEIPELD